MSQIEKWATKLHINIISQVELSNGKNLLSRFMLDVSQSKETARRRLYQKCDAYNILELCRGFDRKDENSAVRRQWESLRRTGA